MLLQREAARQQARDSADQRKAARRAAGVSGDGSGNTIVVHRRPGETHAAARRRGLAKAAALRAAGAKAAVAVLDADAPGGKKRRRLLAQGARIAGRRKKGAGRRRKKGGGAESKRPGRPASAPRAREIPKPEEVADWAVRSPTRPKRRGAGRPATGYSGVYGASDTAKHAAARRRARPKSAQHRLQGGLPDQGWQFDKVPWEELLDNKPLGGAAGAARAGKARRGKGGKAVGMINRGQVRRVARKVRMNKRFDESAALLLHAAVQQ